MTTTALVAPGPSASCNSKRSNAVTRLLSTYRLAALHLRRGQTDKFSQPVTHAVILEQRGQLPGWLLGRSRLFTDLVRTGLLPSQMQPHETASSGRRTWDALPDECPLKRPLQFRPDFLYIHLLAEMLQSRGRGGHPVQGLRAHKQRVHVAWAGEGAR